jgi:hypothetical protein
MPSNGDSFPHVIQKLGSQVAFVIYLLTYLCIKAGFLRRDITSVRFQFYWDMIHCGAILQLHASLQCVR